VIRGGCIQMCLSPI